MKFGLMFTVGLAIGIWGCSENEPDSSTIHDVSMPNGDGGNTLLWIEADEVLEGQCLAGSLPVRDACTNDVRSNSLDEVVNRVTAQLAVDLEEQNSQLTAEIIRLKEADPTVQSLRSQLSSLEAQIAELNSDLDAAYAQHSELEVEIFEKEALDLQYSEQLSAIAGQLESDPDNIDLRRLQIALIDEQQDLHAQIYYLRVDYDAVTQLIYTDEASLELATTEFAEKSAFLEDYFVNLTVGSELMRQIEMNIAHLNSVDASVDGVLTMLRNEGIAYRGTLLSPEQQDVLTRIQASFLSANARIEQGVLQVRYNDEWRGVCDDYFGQTEAIVACRMMGLSFVSYSHSAAGPSGSFWLDNVSCTGSESDLFDCSHNAVGSHNCSYAEHVSLVCE